MVVDKFDVWAASKLVEGQDGRGKGSWIKIRMKMKRG